MAKQVLLDCGLWFDGYDLQGVSNALALEHDADEAEDTVFGQSTRSFQPGLMSVVFSHQGLFDEVVDEILFTRVGVENTAMTIQPKDTAEGSLSYVLPAMAGQYSPNGELGSMFAFSLAGEGNALARGVLLLNRTGLTVGETLGDGYNWGNTPEGQAVYANLHCLSVAGTSPSAVVTIQSAASGDPGFTSPTDRFVFDPVTSIGAQWKPPLPGLVPDSRWRAKVDITGSDSVFALVTSVGRGMTEK